MTKRMLPVAVAIAVVVVASAATLWVQAARGGESPEAEEGHEGHDHAEPCEEEGSGPHLDGIEVMVVEETVSPEYITLAAEIEANAERLSRVGSPVDGRIVSLHARIGDRVSRGERLAVVASRDVADVHAMLTEATAEERAAAGKLSAMKALADAGALTQGPVEAARTDYAGAEAAVEEAAAAVARAERAGNSAEAELRRIKDLASSNAFSAGPVEAAKREVASARAEVDSARALVRVRQSALDRSRRMFDVGLVAKRELESAEADLDQAQAQQQEAFTHLEIAQGALKREDSISSRDLHSIGEVRNAQRGLDDAGKDLRSARNELARARKYRDISKSALAREERVAAGRLNARRELQAAQADLDQARARVSAARSALSALKATGGKTGGATLSITAPMSGVVTARDVSTGQAVQAAQDLFTIEGLDPVWVWGAAYEKDLPIIAIGAEVEVRVRSYPDQVFTGTVRHIARALDKETRTARVRCEVPNPQGVLQPGMFATVNIITDNEKPSLLVPRKALLDEEGGHIVFVACEDCPEDVKAGKSVCGQFDKVSVEAGAMRGDAVEIVSGIEPGASVVVTGQYQLKTAISSGTLDAGCADH